MTLVGKKAPSFTTSAVINGHTIVKDFSLTQFLNKKETILFFYPKDFTYICPTELLELQRNLHFFKKKQIDLIGISTDTEETHLKWLSTPIQQGGIQGVTYPLVADSSKTIAHNYGVLAGEWKVNDEENLTFQGEPIAYRATFLIDKNGIVRHESINDFSLGRNINEILRIIDMWHHTQEYGNVCPINWKKGEQDLTPTPKGVVDYLSNYRLCKCGNQQCTSSCSC